ncbi:MAG: DUF3047 domain-containing protein [Desulfobacterales bacterium]|nr:DUF3047 domain-containing protein [Desulfobacterales bacterium]
MSSSLRKALTGMLAMALSLLLSTSPQAAESVIRIGDFARLTSDSPLPVEWQPLTFKKIKQHTQYRLVNDSGQTVVRANSRNSASGLIRKISIDPRKFPYISWRWKVSSIYAKGDVTRKSGDDYPARIYITFAYNPDKSGIFEKAKYETARLLYGETLPLASITYIWANRAPPGLTIDSAYTGQSKMVVLQSGKAQANQWVTEKRNVYADYKKAFGREPTRISGVAIMTDSDNTGESTRAWYGDIVFSRE